MNRQLWICEFKKKRDLSWPCPSCGNALILKSKDELIEKESVESKNAHAHPEWEPYWIEGSFVAILECSYPACKESVITVGDQKVSDKTVTHSSLSLDEPPEIQPPEVLWDEWVTLYRPRYFQPALRLIDIPESCPSEITEVIKVAFELFWNNTDSCANHIRISLELLCDHFCVPRKINDRFLSPHKRIESLCKLEESGLAPLKEMLIAVKWLGNFGSHGTKTSWEDAVDGFELLEHILSEVFDRPSEKRAMIASRIISRSKE